MDLNVIKAMREAQEQLNKAGIASPQLEAGMLMGHLLNCPRERLYMDRDRVLTPEDTLSYFSLVDKRVRGVPIHYIIGHREFMGLDFYVEEGVLIPRPDTEVLVEHIIEHIKDRGIRTPRIIDLGTGSGAIAISLAKYIEDSLVTAVDIDSCALRVTQKNALAHGLEDRIDLIRADIFTLFEEWEEEWQESKFDVMVSNPPYIPTSDIEGLESQVRDYEPRRALDGGEDGLDFYRALARLGPRILKREGLWAVEVGYNQANSVAHILRAAGCYRDIYFVRDLSGYMRVVAAILDHK